MSIATATANNPTNTKPALQYTVVIRPLGLLYGSAGKFLSPENLVGRSGVSFPPSAATLSGIFAHQLNEAPEKLNNLQLAGPFWANENQPDNFYVPTPLSCLVKDGQIKHTMAWQGGKWQTKIEDKWEIPPNDKYQKATWMAIADWEKINHKPEVKTPPWRFMPHLHPRLQPEQRTVATESDRGSLFLENAVQLEPDACLVYLSNLEIPAGWYRFGGEGHMVELECLPLGETAQKLLDTPLSNSFAIITPAVWGSNRLSYRAPQTNEGTDDLSWHGWEIEALLTGRPIQMRHRLGNKSEGHQSHQPKLLSRGRYAVPAGTVYVLDRPLERTWQQWDESWFPKEGYSYKRWGCGLALPLF
jgi:CRISPR-associated protein Cmr3